MPFLGYRLESILATITSKAGTYRVSLFDLLHSSNLPWHIVPPSLPILDDASPILEKRLQLWLPVLPAHYGNTGRRIVYAMWLYSRGRTSDAIIELNTAQAQCDQEDATLMLSIDLLTTDMLLTLGHVESGVARIHSTLNRSRSIAISPVQRTLVKMYVAESLLTMDLPAIASQILEENVHSTDFESPAYEHLYQLLRSISMRRADWLPGSLHEVHTYPTVSNIACRGLSRSMIWRVRRLNMGSTKSRYAREASRRFVESTIDFDDDRLIDAFRRLQGTYPLGILRAVLIGIATTSFFGVAHRAIATHMIYTDVYQHASKSLAYDTWNSLELASGTAPATTFDNELYQLLDSATKQNSSLRDDFTTVSNRIKVLSDHVRDTDRIRRDLLIPIRRLEREIETIVTSAIGVDEVVSVHEMRKQLQRATEEILQDVEEILRRIRNPRKTNDF